MQQQYATVNTELALDTLGGTTQIEMILSVQSSWSKGISETKLKQQSPCSNCMHWPVTSWPKVGSHHTDRTYGNKTNVHVVPFLSPLCSAETSQADHMHLLHEI